MEHAAPALIGVGVALSLAIFAAVTRLDRERSFYPIVLIVSASYYELFATMAGGGAVLAAEAVGFVLFSGAAILGLKKNLWIVVGALCGHAVFDVVHGGIIPNSGVPHWWPAFCIGIDIAAAACLAARISVVGAAADSPEPTYERLIENSAL